MMAAWLFCHAGVSGFQNLESAYRTTGQAVMTAFEAQRQVLQTSSAVMLNGRREVAYGVVISADGWVLTKASEIAAVPALGVRIDQQTYRDAVVHAIDETWDVALLKVEASGLVPVVFASKGDAPQGTWVVANGVTSLRERRALAGIVSAKSRRIPDGGGNLGVAFKEDDARPLVAEVGDGSAAAKAGLKKGDLIVSVDGARVETFEQLADALKERRPGTVVKIGHLRKNVEREVEVTLDSGPLTRNDLMSGQFSERRSGFPRVLQHDIIGHRSIVGGPLLDLDGRCLGMNIARANRAESYAIPVEDLRELAARLMNAK